jgi:hypothetical protein
MCTEPVEVFITCQHTNFTHRVTEIRDTKMKNLCCFPVFLKNFPNRIFVFSKHMSLYWTSEPYIEWFCYWFHLCYPQGRHFRIHVATKLEWHLRCFILVEFYKSYWICIIMWRFVFGWGKVHTANHRILLTWFQICDGKVSWCVIFLFSWVNNVDIEISLPISPAIVSLLFAWFHSGGSPRDLEFTTQTSVEGFVVHVSQHGNKAVDTLTSNNTPSPLSFPVETVSSSRWCRQTRTNTSEWIFEILSVDTVRKE